MPSGINDPVSFSLIYDAVILLAWKPAGTLDKQEVEGNLVANIAIDFNHRNSNRSDFLSPRYMLPEMNQSL